MKKGIVALLIAAFSVLAASAQRHEVFNFQSSEARALDLNPASTVVPLVAEIIVDSVTGRINDSWHISPSDFLARQIPNNYEATLNNLRAYGLFKSSLEHNCDIIVAPIFDIAINNQGATINLIGYPANFANWSNEKGGNGKAPADRGNGSGQQMEVPVTIKPVR